MHAIAAILPKSGLGADRPHSFSMTYPNGQIDLFSAGTEDLVVEWTATANYWAARKSRQPLKGGVSNMEYGWTRALETAANDQEDKFSVKSGRSNFSKIGGTYGRRAAGGMAEKMHINDWKSPPPATMPSPLDEESQLEVLITYVRSLVEELEGHKAIEEPMSRMVSRSVSFVPRSSGVSTSRAQRMVSKPSKTGWPRANTSTPKCTSTKRTWRFCATPSLCV